MRVLRIAYTPPPSKKGLAMSNATLPQATKVLELIAQKKVPSDRLQRLLEGGFLADLLEADSGLKRDEFRQFLKLGNLYPDLTELPGIIIPDNTTIETLKTACECNQSDYASQYLTSEHFKVAVRGSRNLFLAHFNRKVTSEHVKAVAEEMGYKVALVEDLLCVGAHPEHRELQRQFPIRALGSSSVVRGDRRVPSLDRWYDERYLYLTLCGGEWDDCCRFLFVGRDKPSDA